MTDKVQLKWYDPVWKRQAHDWIRAKANHNSIQITGEIEQPHVYHWSTVMSVPSNKGTLFFKATAPETAYEITLTQRLAEWYPEDLPELISLDTRQGWMLMHDGGDQLRTSIRPAQDIKPWEPVINRYAELQIGLARHVDEILTLGIPDHRLAYLPQHYSRLLADEDSLMIGQEKGLAAYEFQQLRNLKSRFDQICTELDAFGIPESLNHGDFHDGNVLFKNGRITFFDWGDADVTHPFVSLRTFFVSIEIALELDDYAFTPEMAVLLDIYLKPFQKYASKDQLLKAYALSKPVASIVRALGYYQSITQMNASMREEHAGIVPELLKEFLFHEKILLENTDSNPHPGH